MGDGTLQTTTVGACSTKGYTSRDDKLDEAIKQSRTKAHLIMDHNCFQRKREQRVP
jgi:hypothetical protein